MNGAAGYDVLWLPEDDEGSAEPSPIRVWKSIRLVAVGEAYRVALTSGPLTAGAGPRRTTLIKADAVRADTREAAGCYELTTVRTQRIDGETIFVMRRIS